VQRSNLPRTEASCPYQVTILAPRHWWGDEHLHAVTYRYIPLHAVTHRYTPLHTVAYRYRQGDEYLRAVGKATRGDRTPGQVTFLVHGRQLNQAKAFMSKDEREEGITLEHQRAN
jgi:hypothetical protein